MARRSSPVTVGDVLAKSARLSRPGQLSWWQWHDIVGHRVAVRSQPVSLERGTLLVRVQSSLWAQELSLLHPMIQEALLRRGIDVQRIRFTVGKLDLPETRPALQRREARPLPADLRERLEKIEDPELRQAIAEAASLTLS